MSNQDTEFIPDVGETVVVVEHTTDIELQCSRQVRVVHSSTVGEWSKGVPLGKTLVYCM